VSCEQRKLIRETWKAGDAPPRPAFNEVRIDQAKRNMVVALRHNIGPYAFDPVAGPAGDL
jgi:hypothetical protein